MKTLYLFYQLTTIINVCALSTWIWLEHTAGPVRSLPCSYALLQVIVYSNTLSNIPKHHPILSDWQTGRQVSFITISRALLLWYLQWILILLTGKWFTKCKCNYVFAQISCQVEFDFKSCSWWAWDYLKCFSFSSCS